MSEWQPFETAPKDGREILAATEDYIYLIEMDQVSREWYFSPGHATSVEFTHWMEAPELPVKEHECIIGVFTCKSDSMEGFVIHDEMNRNILYCDYCPFCGEKA